MTWSVIPPQRAFTNRALACSLLSGFSKSGWRGLLCRIVFRGRREKGETCFAFRSTTSSSGRALDQGSKGNGFESHVANQARCQRAPDPKSGFEIGKPAASPPFLLTSRLRPRWRSTAGLAALCAGADTATGIRPEGDRPLVPVRPRAGRGRAHPNAGCRWLKRRPVIAAPGGSRWTASSQHAAVNEKE